MKPCSLLHSLHQNIAAYAVELHTHPDCGRFLQRFSQPLAGYPGLFDLAIRMAEVTSEWEFRSGGLAAYELQGLEWSEVVETLTNYVIRRSILAGVPIADYAGLAQVFRELLDPPDDNEERARRDLFVDCPSRGSDADE